MTSFQIQYPGDPVVTVTVLTGAEFLALQTEPREIIMRSPGQPEIHIPINEIICDMCNDEILLTDTCAEVARCLYCHNCYCDYLLPYKITP